ncbi:hypothetical protein FRC08_006009 [Ceratobasidium sp. 394]|nr:hypothetical protein FRC08_006009 [Ceratobasidium sp. 394]
MANRGPICNVCEARTRRTRRRVQCDRARPSCGWCDRHPDEGPCTYADDPPPAPQPPVNQAQPPPAQQPPAIPQPPAVPQPQGAQLPASGAGPLTEVDAQGMAILLRNEAVRAAFREQFALEEHARQEQGRTIEAAAEAGAYRHSIAHATTTATAGTARITDPTPAPVIAEESAAIIARHPHALATDPRIALARYRGATSVHLPKAARAPTAVRVPHHRTGTPGTARKARVAERIVTVSHPPTIKHRSLCTPAAIRDTTLVPLP